MELDDLKDRYKGIPVWGRCVAALVLGTLPGLYIYSEQGDGLDQELASAKSRVVAAEKDLSSKMTDKAQIPKLEQTLAFTQDQLEKAKKSLPDKFDIDDLLQKTASIAREVGVQLKSFEPSKPVTQSQGAVRYVQLPVAINMSGRFHQIATYLDRLAHLETAIFVRGLQLQRQMGGGERGEAQVELSEHQKNVEARKNMQMQATYTMVLYRGMSSEDDEVVGSGTVPDVARAASDEGGRKL